MALESASPNFVMVDKPAEPDVNFVLVEEPETTGRALVVVPQRTTAVIALPAQPPAASNGVEPPAATNGTQPAAETPVETSKEYGSSGKGCECDRNHES